MLDVARQCPCCGGPAPGIAAAWFYESGSLIVCGAAIRFSASEAKIFNALWLARGQTVSTQRLITALYGDRIDGGPDAAIKAVQVFVSHVRVKLKGSSIGIANVWGQGWSLKHNGASS